MSSSAVFGGIGLLMSALQYRSTVAAGKAEQEFYNAQARNRRLQGRVEAVEAKEKGNEILRRAKAAIASNITGGYASGVIPTVGSVQTVTQQQVLKPAVYDINITALESILAIEKANREAGYLEYRGQMAASQARTQALGGLVMSGVQAGLSGAFSGLGGSGGISGAGVASNASQINTAGVSSVMRAGQTSAISGGVFNTAGGGMNFTAPQGIRFF